MGASLRAVTEMDGPRAVKTVAFDVVLHKPDRGNLYSAHKRRDGAAVIEAFDTFLTFVDEDADYRWYREPVDFRQRLDANIEKLRDDGLPDYMLDKPDLDRLGKRFRIGGGAAPAYRAVAVSTYAGSGTSDSVSKPTGTISGDLVMVAVGLFEDGAAVLNLQDPVSISGLATDKEVWNFDISGEEIQSTVLWKIAGGSEPSTYDPTWGSSHGNKSMAVAISGPHATTPIEASVMGAGSNTNSVVFGTPTSGGTERLAVYIGLNWFGATWTPDGSLTERSDATLWLATEAISSAGAIDAETVSLNTTTPAIPYVALIQPPAAGGITVKPLSALGVG